MPRLKTFMVLLALMGFAGAPQAAEEKGHHHAGHGPGHAANEHMNKRSLQELIARFESPERQEWQRSDTLLDTLGDLSGKTVADIGSGSGFLAFKMVERGARVLCVDVDERFLAYILGKRDGLGLTDEIELRPSPYEKPLLNTNEADLIITVNTYHHIEDRVSYFRHVRNALVTGGQLVVVDFKEGEQRVGPPESMKIAASQIESELREAGFENFSVDRDTLPYQFVLTAS